MKHVNVSRRRILRGAAVLGGALSLGGCASLMATQTRALRHQPPADLPLKVEWSEVPFFPQLVNQCGPAALATAMGAIGTHISPDVLGTAVFVPGREGSLQIEMLAAPRTHGLIATRIRPDLLSLLREVAAGQSPVVLMNLGLAVKPLWHYAVVVGYDLIEGVVVMRSGTEKRQLMPLETFEMTWSRSSQWAFVVLPPDKLPAQSDEPAVTEARVAFERVAKPAQAVVAYEAGLQRWPDSLLMGLGLANALYASRDWLKAEAQYERVAQQHNSAPAWHNLAQLRLEQGHLAGARVAAESAVRAAEADANWQSAAQSILAKVNAHQP